MRTEIKYHRVTLTLLAITLILWIKALVLKEQSLIVPIIGTSTQLAWLIYILLNRK
jgi:hypothetical protein